MKVDIQYILYFCLATFSWYMVTKGYHFHLSQSFVWIWLFSTWRTGAWLCTPFRTVVTCRTNITMELTQRWLARKWGWRCGTSCNWDNRLSLDVVTHQANGWTKMPEPFSAIPQRKILQKESNGTGKCSMETSSTVESKAMKMLN